MLGSDYGNDSNYAHTRISGTIVMYNGQPVYVDQVLTSEETKKPTAVVRWLSPNQHQASFIVDLSNLEVCTPPLGYANYEGMASYITRKPMRNDWRQGIRHNNLLSVYGYDIGSLPTEALYPLLINEYPKYKDCLKFLEEDTGNRHSQAWAKDWAINISGELLYRFGNVVGTIKNGEPILEEKFNYLSDSLLESIK